MGTGIFARILQGFVGPNFNFFTFKMVYRVSSSKSGGRTLGAWGLLGFTVWGRAT